MASAAGDPSEVLCANMLEGCTKLKALLLKLKESLLRDKATVRLQAAARGVLGQATGTGSDAIATFRGDGTGAASRRRLRGSACLS